MTFASPQNKFKNILWVPAALSASALEGGRVISGEASASLPDSGPVIRNKEVDPMTRSSLVVNTGLVLGVLGATGM